MARDFLWYMERAEALLAQGFTTKQARKDASEYAGRGFEFVRDALHKTMLLDAGITGWHGLSDATRAAYDSIPYSAAHWNAKRRKLLAALPQYASFLANLDSAAELRARIAAAPDAPKAPVTRTAKQLAKDAHARECQICGRQIFAERGKVAHHGYERPGHGWQTASCYGAMRAPYTADRDALLELIPGQIESLARQRAALADAKAERIPITLYFTRGDYRNKQSHSVTFTRKTLAAALYFARPAFGDQTIAKDGTIYDYEAHAEISIFDKCKRRDMAERAGRIKQTKDFIAYLEGRRDAWVKREAWDAKAKTWKPA